MSVQHRAPDGLLTLIVLAHLAVSVVHGWAHTGAVVPISPTSNIFILVVIVAAPLVGVAVLWFFSIAGGAWLLAFSLAAAFVFGVVNHFVLESPDHVARVAAQWQVSFGVTAVLLALTEALGSGLAFWRAAHARMR
jgi:predicted outer membrane lipoprotein